MIISQFEANSTGLLGVAYDRSSSSISMALTIISFANASSSTANFV